MEKESMTDKYNEMNDIEGEREIFKYDKKAERRIRQI